MSYTGFFGAGYLGHKFVAASGFELLVHWLVYLVDFSVCIKCYVPLTICIPEFCKNFLNRPGKPLCVLQSCKLMCF